MQRSNHDTVKLSNYIKTRFIISFVHLVRLSLLASPIAPWGPVTSILLSLTVLTIETFDCVRMHGNNQLTKFSDERSCYIRAVPSILVGFSAPLHNVDSSTLPAVLCTAGRSNARTLICLHRHQLYRSFVQMKLITKI